MMKYADLKFVDFLGRCGIIGLFCMGVDKVAVSEVNLFLRIIMVIFGIVFMLFPFIQYVMINKIRGDD